MNNLNYLAGLLLIIALSYSCSRDAKNQQEKFQVVKINLSENPSASLSDFVENPEMIKLETNDSCLISNISRVELTPEYLFVSDYKKLYQFDKKGNYIRTIGRIGHGPHEYTGLVSCFTCSEQDRRIYLGLLRKILCFDFDGNFVEEIKFNSGADRLEVSNNQLWAFYTKYNRLSGMKSENQSIINRYSLKGGVLQDSIVLKSIKLDIQQGVLAPNMQYVSEAFDQLYLYSPILIREPILRDTLYLFKQDRLVAALKVDFSDFAESNERGKNVSIMNINRSEKYLFAEYNYQGKLRLFVYDFPTGKQYNLTQGFTDDIYRTGQVVLRPLDTKFQQMYFTRDGYELEGKVEGVTENSNPVIFIVDLKK